jgi:hypothetical protein
MSTNWEESRALYVKRDALQAEVHEIQAQIEDLHGNPFSADYYRDLAQGKPDAYERLRAREFLRDGKQYAGDNAEVKARVREYASRLVTEGAEKMRQAADVLGSVIVGSAPCGTSCMDAPHSCCDCKPADPANDKIDLVAFAKACLGVQP